MYVCGQAGRESHDAQLEHRAGEVLRRVLLRRQRRAAIPGTYIHTYIHFIVLQVVEAVSCIYIHIYIHTSNNVCIILLYTYSTAYIHTYIHTYIKNFLHTSHIYTDVCVYVCV